MLIITADAGAEDFDATYTLSSFTKRLRNISDINTKTPF